MKKLLLKLLVGTSIFVLLIVVAMALSNQSWAIWVICGILVLLVGYLIGDIIFQ